MRQSKCALVANEFRGLAVETKVLKSVMQLEIATGSRDRGVSAGLVSEVAKFGADHGSQQMIACRTR